ncbi:flavin reductase family protein [Streptomyces spongiae]|uniref:Flavin reductase family protein n=1 Tax=Streptomyces spongiae TaxID=565072 RepID=A0A5N8X994_9ACTN|nr:flavin reductase family protein [Streptomyces spongiae]MPY55674.1 flavin reductase family protein [Streptomyces spongiae]
MGSVCTPVSVVTTFSHGRPHGTTVSAFSALSLEPPMVLVALDRNSTLLSLLQQKRRFGLNVLGARQGELAMRFADKGADKFEGVPWQVDTGLPRLPGVTGWLACEVTRFVDGGDHLVVMGRVIAASCRDGAPLTYHRRGFGTHAVLEEKSA